MKKTLIALAALMISVAAYGQGAVVFNTRVGTTVNAPVSRANGAGAGAGFQAQLFLARLSQLDGGRVCKCLKSRGRVQKVCTKISPSWSFC